MQTWFCCEHLKDPSCILGCSAASQLRLYMLWCVAYCLERVNFHCTHFVAQNDSWITEFLISNHNVTNNLKHCSLLWQIVCTAACTNSSWIIIWIWYPNVAVREIQQIIRRAAQCDIWICPFWMLYLHQTRSNKHLRVKHQSHRQTFSNIINAGKTKIFRFKYEATGVKLQKTLQLNHALYYASSALKNKGLIICKYPFQWITSGCLKLWQIKLCFIQLTVYTREWFRFLSHMRNIST